MRGFLSVSVDVILMHFFSSRESSGVVLMMFVASSRVDLGSTRTSEFYEDNFSKGSEPETFHLMWFFKPLQQVYGSSRLYLVEFEKQTDAQILRFVVLSTCFKHP